MSMKRYAIIKMTDDFIQHLGVVKTFNNAVASAYNHMNDELTNDGDLSAILTPLEKLEGDTGYGFTYTQPANKTHVELKTTIYILEYNEKTI